MGGKSSPDKQTVAQEPWESVQQPLENLYGATQNALGNILPYYPNQTYANLNPLQEAGMFGGLDYAQNMMFPATLGYQQNLANYMDAPLNIASNPAVTSMMDVNRQRAVQALTEDMLPAIRGNAVAAGQYGGSRQGIAEGQAIGRTADALTAANAQTMLGALDPMTRLAGFASTAFPGALQMGLTPSQLATQYGDVYGSQTQLGIDEAMKRYFYPEESLWSKLGTASNIYQGAGSYGTQTTQLPGSSPIAGALGGAAAGAGIGTALGFTNPLFAIGGGLLGLLG